MQKSPAAHNDVHFTCQLWVPWCGICSLPSASRTFLVMAICDKGSWASAPHATTPRDNPFPSPDGADSPLGRHNYEDFWSWRSPAAFLRQHLHSLRAASPHSHASHIRSPSRLLPRADTPVASFWEKSNVSPRVSQPLPVLPFVWVPSSCCPSCFLSACWRARLSHGVSTTFLWIFYVLLARELWWSTLFGWTPSRVFHINISLLAPTSAQPLRGRRWSGGMSLLHETHPPLG